MPTAIQQIRGNPGKRPLGHREPQPRVVAPRCPPHVLADPNAATEWRRMVPLLKRMRVLTEADGNLLATYCLTHSNLLRNLEAVNTLNAAGSEKSKSTGKSDAITKFSGVVIATKTGYLAPNQFYINVNNCIEQLLKLGRELGLTPAARTRIQVGKERAAPDDPWADM
jgi:P27 family predicted phage terminase small subunit